MVKPLATAVPSNSSVPALKTIVPLAVPPASTICVPPKTGVKNDWAPETLAPLA
jgi:hypothetical protein